MLDQLFEERYLPEPLVQMVRATRQRRPRVVITGMGVLAPNGNTVKEFWANSLAGVSGVAAIERWDASPYPSRVAGLVKNFDSREYMDFKEARRMARCSSSR